MISTQSRKPLYTHRPLSISFLGLPYRTLSISHKKKELLRGLWVVPKLDASVMPLAL